VKEKGFMLFFIEFVLLRLQNIKLFSMG